MMFRGDGRGGHDLLWPDEREGSTDTAEHRPGVQHVPQQCQAAA